MCIFSEKPSFRQTILPTSYENSLKIHELCFVSDNIKHECGVAMVRLRKPLSYYKDKYGSVFYGLNRLYLLMEKQRNRGQDGVGVASVKLNIEPGHKYINRIRSVAGEPIQDAFDKIHGPINQIPSSKREDVDWIKAKVPFASELYLGHLRYGTYGKNSVENCHPFLRQNNWLSKNLVLAGNFNLTNVDELFNMLVSIGQHPKKKADTVTVLEKIGHYLDVENQRIFDIHKSLGYSNFEISSIIAEKLDVASILKNASESFDGGYIMCGLFGHGDAFALRDPNGIRPAFYYADDEVVVVTSERPAIQTAFNVPYNSIHEITPGSALIIKKDGSYEVKPINNPGKKLSCSFERIYFSRGTDQEIYKERKKLGELLSDRIVNIINHDFKNTVFSYIPNTAETSFFGLIKELEQYVNQMKIEKIKENGANISELIHMRPRVEKIAVKDVKLRTFITEDSSRNDLVQHVYDITYGTVNPHEDTLVVLDDSIVRGTTLKRSILSILDRLHPKKIIVVSSAPQIRYPDCYGIDMAKLGDFIAFQAAISLLHDTGNEHLLDEVYNLCLEENKKKKPKTNHVKKIYQPFTPEEISNKSAELLKPEGMSAKVEIVYNSIENLHKACPKNLGDWYFTGNYPTIGGNRVVNRSFINYMEGKNIRAY